MAHELRQATVKPTLLDREPAKRPGRLTPPTHKGIRITAGILEALGTLIASGAIIAFLLGCLGLLGGEPEAPFWRTLSWAVCLWSTCGFLLGIMIVGFGEVLDLLVGIHKELLRRGPYNIW